MPSNATCTTASKTPQEMLAAMRAAREKMKALQAADLRSTAKVSEVTCSVCKRKVIVTNNGFGDTLHVCRHLWAVLQSLPKAEDITKPLGVIDPFMLRIELLDDGPKRW